MLPIGQQQPGGRLEFQIIEQLFGAARGRTEDVVNSEDSLVVGAGEEKGFLLLQPLRLLSVDAVAV